MFRTLSPRATPVVVLAIIREKARHLLAADQEEPERRG